jgi:hypothetical protein
VQGRGLAPELQVDEHDLAPALELCDYSADDAPRSFGDRFDVQLDSLVIGEQPQHGDLGESDQALEHLLRISLESAGDLARRWHPFTLAASTHRRGDVSPLRSEEPVNSTGCLIHAAVTTL